MDAQKWLTNHPVEASKYQGMWVAISGNGIELSAESLLKLLKEKGKTNYLVTKIPTLKELEDVLY
ncbi:Uncharacterised protein [Candidatus Norongarragalina meridionalis]|nr:Uncharacterised protein [Candidatus Norongarragalina meridionalis]